MHNNSCTTQCTLHVAFLQAYSVLYGGQPRGTKSPTVYCMGVNLERLSPTVYCMGVNLEGLCLLLLYGGQPRGTMSPTI